MHNIELWIIITTKSCQNLDLRWSSHRNYNILDALISLEPFRFEYPRTNMVSNIVYPWYGLLGQRLSKQNIVRLDYLKCRYNKAQTNYSLNCKKCITDAKMLQLHCGTNLSIFNYHNLTVIEIKIYTKLKELMGYLQLDSRIIIQTKYLPSNEYQLLQQLYIHV